MICIQQEHTLSQYFHGDMLDCGLIVLVINFKQLCYSWAKTKETCLFHRQ